MNQHNLIETAAQFVNTTESHIFLTGKAGTGKTTFLRELAIKTHKQFLIVAPTGIAALNAGGVTIHSQFQLPLGTFLPDRTPSGEFSSNNQLYTQYTLTRKHPISSLRKQVLRSIELLIIDEVSMLRADVLDAIDYRMRSVRGNFSKSFGGVQVLMIGDLYQLPPIVKDHEWTYLKRFYHSAHFFEAKALQLDGFVTVELEKIFRQSDDTFISLLNNLRNNITTAADIELLNSYFKTSEEIKQEEGVITITTHNYRADDINGSEMSQLPSKSFFYEARVEGEFPESIYPIAAKMELKVGAQVMFVKNDTSGESKFFNGKLAKVIELDDTSVTVEMDTSKEHFVLRRYDWENMRYTVNSSSRELDEEVIGTFSQFPIKPAWAVTVHKSQGLTFDKAIIDVGTAFAPGQVYVALSRLRSLDGLILRTRISASVISNDEKVVAFSSQKMAAERLNEMLQEKQRFYVNELIKSTFDFFPLIKELAHKLRNNHEDEGLNDDSMKSTLKLIQESLNNETNNTNKFKEQLLYLHHTREIEALSERLMKGGNYYSQLFKEHIQNLFNHIEQVKQLGRKKGYLNELYELDQMLAKKFSDMKRSSSLIKSILNNKDIDVSKNDDIVAERNKWKSEALNYANNHPIKTQRKTSKAKTKTNEKADTVRLTVELFFKKMTLGQIAEQRGLALSTVEGHLSKAVEQELLVLKDIMSKEVVDEITDAWKASPEAASKHIYESLGEKYSYGKIKAVKSFLDKSKS